MSPDNKALRNTQSSKRLVKSSKRQGSCMSQILTPEGDLIRRLTWPGSRQHGLCTSPHFKWRCFGHFPCLL